MPASRIRTFTLNLTIALLSLVLTLAAGEGVIRVLQRLDYLPTFSHRNIDKGDTPNKHVNARLVRSENPALFMEFDRNDPNINNAGFRGADFHIEKTAGTLRIAILGDSVAYGYSVPLEQTFARLLEQQLRDQGHSVEVLNFAVNGYSTAAELELYKTRVREYHPDIVLLAYVLNDPIPAAFVVQSVGSARKQVDGFKQLAKWSQLGAWLYLRWQVLQQPLRNRNNYQQMYTGDSWRNTTTALQSLQQETAVDGATLVGAIFPLLLDFDNYPMRAIHQQVTQALTDAHIPHIDLLDDFSRVPYMELRPHPNDDTHPNAEGHAIAAKRIGELLLTLPALGDR